MPKNAAKVKLKITFFWKHESSTMTSPSRRKVANKIKDVIHSWSPISIGFKLDPFWGCPDGLEVSSNDLYTLFFENLSAIQGCQTKIFQAIEVGQLLDKKLLTSCALLLDVVLVSCEEQSLEVPVFHLLANIQGVNVDELNETLFD